MRVLQPQDPLTTSFLAEFQRCRDWIKNALKYAHDSHSPEDVLIMCQKGDAQFWSFKDSAIITEIIDYPKRRVLRFWLAGGKLKTLLEVEKKIIHWSKFYSC